MTATGYLLDTDIVSSLVREPGGKVASRIRAVGENNVATSLVVAAELRFGACKKGSTALSNQLEAVLGALEVLPLEEPSDAHYGRLRHALEQAGTPIGPNDMLIAAHALALDRILVTANTQEFERVSGLQLENWLL